GSHCGRSAAAIGAKLKATGGHLTCVDLWGDEVCYRAFLQHVRRLGLPVSPLRMDSLQAPDHFAEGALDFVFIDTSHDYEDVVCEVLAWLPKLRPNGRLCGHDYRQPLYPGVEQAVREWCPGFENPVDSIWAVPAFPLRLNRPQGADLLAHWRGALLR